MTEPTIISREAIAQQAAAAAAEWLASGPNAPRPLNPHLLGSDAAAAWSASFDRALDGDEAEGAEA